MSEHFLDRTDIVIGLKKMRGKVMAKGVGRDPLGKLSFLDRMVQRALASRLMDMISTFFP